MLDIRYKTFKELCRLKSYTKTAKSLYITQPAVTQHIKYLENIYGCKLFIYKNRNLYLTREGEILKNYVIKMESDASHIKDVIKNETTGKKSLNFGATLTIGEYIMPEIIKNIFMKEENINISMCVENTEVLLNKLIDKEISFAVIEGFFDKTKYDYRLFSLEDFICVASPGLIRENTEYDIYDLLSYPVILREKGSGTRAIWEQILNSLSLKPENFKRYAEIGNMNAIKELVKDGMGITFLYKSAVKKELQEKSLCPVKISNLNIKREFNFVYLKNSIHKNEYNEYFELMKKYYK